MIFTRKLLIQWNQSPYTGDSLVALSGGIMSLERHAFLSCWMPLFYVSISVCVVCTFMVNWKQITSKITLEWLLLHFFKAILLFFSSSVSICSTSANLTVANFKNYAYPQGKLRTGSELEPDWDDVYCNTSKSMLPKKKLQRLLIFIETRNRCLNRASVTFDRSTMDLSERVSFSLSLTGRSQTIKTVILLSFHYLFQRITFDISNFFFLSLNPVLRLLKLHDFVCKSKWSEKYISTHLFWTLGWPHCFLCLPVDHANYFWFIYLCRQRSAHVPQKSTI